MAEEGEQPEGAGDSGPEPLRSGFTSGFPDLLRGLGISLAVSTYQAGKLIFLRAQGEKLNTHFRVFNSPMGVAYQPETGRFAVGTKTSVQEFRNQPGVAPKVDPPGSCDAAFMPRRTMHTGDIRIHEIAWIGERLWAANTRFSCLCTFDAENSFLPRWRPPFVSALAPEDRCHLNGLAVVDGEVRYVTCLGKTDVAGGWRENKRSGGLLLDVPGGEVILRGLSMPHSPRMHLGAFWILESGRGTLSIADLDRGAIHPVVKLPGFTRGLDFCGEIAFVGLSQVRESAVFSGIPLVEELSEEKRCCGVWAVHLKTGQVLGFVRFEGAVQEIFSVAVLPGLLSPDLINEPGELLDNSFVLPEEAIREVPAGLL